MVFVHRTSFRVVPAMFYTYLAALLFWLLFSDAASDFEYPETLCPALLHVGRLVRWMWSSCVGALCRAIVGSTIDATHVCCSHDACVGLFLEDTIAFLCGWKSGTTPER